MFQVGQLVVCVETWTSIAGKGNGDEIGPVEGQIYRIRNIFQHEVEKILVVRLFEIKNPIRSYKSTDGIVRKFECSFKATRFRPLDDNRLSIFRQILVNPKKKITEDA